MRHVSGSLLSHDDPSLAMMVSSGDYHVRGQRFPLYTSLRSTLHHVRTASVQLFAARGVNTPWYRLGSYVRFTASKETYS